MVTVPHSGGWSIRIVMAVVAAVAALMVSGAAAASADPSGDPGTSFGFDKTCNDLHDTLSQIPLIGGFLGDEASVPCKALNVGTHPGDALTAAADKMWDSSFGQVVDELLLGMGQLLVVSLTWWTKIPNAQLLDSNDLFTRISSYTDQLQLYLLSASIMVGAARLAMAHRHAKSDEAVEVVRVLARSVIATWMAGAIVLGAARAGDAFASWVIDTSTHNNARAVAESMVKESSYHAFSPGLVLIIALVGLLGLLAMTAMTVIRQGMLLLAMGMLPMAAAGSGLGSGKLAHQRLWAWIVAFLLWKPVAALVYMIAFTTADATDDGKGAGVESFATAEHRLVGLVLLCTATFVLPALMRLVAPMVSAAGSGGSGAAATGAAITAAAAIATGGKSLVGGGAAGGGVGRTATGVSSVGGPGGRHGKGAAQSPPSKKGADAGRPSGAGARSSGGPTQATPAGSEPTRKTTPTPTSPLRPPHGTTTGNPSIRRPSPDNDIPI